MSRIRVHNGPDGWQDQGGCTPFVIRGHGGTLVTGSEPDKATPAELALRQSALLRKPEKPPKPKVKRQRRICITGCQRMSGHRGQCSEPEPRCEHLMLIAREGCARMAGHKGPHATRVALTQRTQHRRTWVKAA
jgi:hypothetical protein